MRHSDHDVLAMEVDAEVSTAEELKLEPEQSVAGLEEISGVHKQMEGDAVTVQKRF